MGIPPEHVKPWGREALHSLGDKQQNQSQDWSLGLIKLDLELQGFVTGLV